ncbi:MAG: hypothetical protein AAF170_14960 [Bacteroidota bacterium]
MSNVFHVCPQEHDHRALALGSQAHFGQAIFMTAGVELANTKT